MSDIGHKNGLVTHSNQKQNQNWNRSQSSLDTFCILPCKPNLSERKSDSETKSAVQCGQGVIFVTAAVISILRSTGRKKTFCELAVALTEQKIYQ